MTTFIVRLFAARGGHFRGLIEHVRTGEKMAFYSGEELLSFLSQLNATDGQLDMETEEPDDALSDPSGKPTRRSRKMGSSDARSALPIPSDCARSNTDDR